MNQLPEQKINTLKAKGRDGRDFFRELAVNVEKGYHSMQRRLHEPLLKKTA